MGSIAIFRDADDCWWHFFNGHNVQQTDLLRLGDFFLGLQGNAALVFRPDGSAGPARGAEITAAFIDFTNKVTQNGVAANFTVYGGNSDPDNVAGRVLNRQTLGPPVGGTPTQYDFWKTHLNLELDVQVRSMGSVIEYQSSAATVLRDQGVKDFADIDSEGNHGAVAISQKFTVGTSFTLQDVRWRLKRNGTFVSSQLYEARIRTEDLSVTHTSLPGVPGATTIWSEPYLGVDLQSISTSYSWITFSGANPTLTPGDYWVTLEPLSASGSFLANIQAQAKMQFSLSFGGGTRGAGVGFDQFGACPTAASPGNTWHERDTSYPTVSFDWPTGAVINTVTSTPDISSIVQAQVNSPWYQRGDPLVFHVNGNAAGRRDAWSHEAPASREPVLRVFYRDRTIAVR